jgi:dTMP kinase
MIYSSPGGLPMTNEWVRTGTLISLEGIDGAGKDTQVDLLAAELASLGLPIKVFRFPDYDGPLGILLKSVLHDPSCDAFTFQLLFSADRFRQSSSVRQALTDDYIIITSRYKASSYAYAVARGLPREWAVMLESPLPDPTLTILLDIDVSTSRKRTGAEDVLEGNALVMERCRSEYLNLARRRDKWKVVDGSPAPAIVADVVQRIVRDLLDLH